ASTIYHLSLHDALPISTTEEHSSLSLNNGEKWDADESTNLHAEKLIAQVNAFNSKQNPDLQAYQSFGADMQNELNGLIKDCKMRSEEHTSELQSRENLV